MPKGVPLRPGERHLAVHVEDHPLDYADFEGMIPAGEYGAGTVEIWDRGWYELLEEKKNGGLTVRLHGERLDGVWTLVPAQLDGNPKNWLLLKKSEKEGGSGRARARLRYGPMLSTSAETLPDGEGWVYEPKWDGYRAIVTVSSGEVAFTSRSGERPHGALSRPRARVALGIRTADAVLDGEICALDNKGRSRFALLQEGAGTLALVVFDLLELDSEPSSTSRSPSGGSGSRSRRHEQGGRLRLAAVRRRRGVARGCAPAGARGGRRQAGGLEYQPGRRIARVAEAEGPAGAGGRVVGYTKGEGRRAAASARSSWPFTRPAGCAGRGTSAPGTATPRSSAC